jgi:hypothetical protein
MSGTASFTPGGGTPPPAPSPGGIVFRLPPAA